MRTSDLALAAYLVTEGYQILRIESVNGSRKKVFVFKDGERLRKLSEDFWNRKLKVDALTYFEALKGIKNRIFTMAQ